MGPKREKKQTYGQYVEKWEWVTVGPKCPFGLQWFLRLHFCTTFFSSFFFFGSARNSWLCQLWTVHPCTVHGSEITLFSNFFIKNGSHNTIYTFKNYFAIVFSVSVFSFSKNKLNPNTPTAFTLSYLKIIYFFILINFLKTFTFDYLLYTLFY